MTLRLALAALVLWSLQASAQERVRGKVVVSPTLTPSPSSKMAVPSTCGSRGASGKGPELSHGRDWRVREKMLYAPYADPDNYSGEAIGWTAICALNLEPY